jgi:serine phosphatase RsbU (regulator of sigma subunit)
MVSRSQDARAGILLVEDDDEDALLVKEELHDVPGAPQLQRARSIAEAAELLKTIQPECALLDLGLPGYGGLEALTALRKLSPELPVVVLTGMADEQQGIDSLSSGAQDYLVKGSVDGAIIVRAVRYAVERHRAERAHGELREAELRAQENARLERGLLPQPLVSDETIRFSWKYRPGQRRSVLGGDFFDIVETPSGATRVIVGDVCGHGPDEAALGASLRIAWRTLVLSGTDVDQILPTLDRVLIGERHSSNIYATLADIYIEPDRSAIHVRLAGHPPPFRILDGRVDTIDGDVGIPIGLGELDRWPVNTHSLAEGAALMLYTDGLIDGYAGDRSTRLGVEGLAEVLADSMRERPWTESLDAFLQDVIDRVENLNGGDVPDDIATLIVTWS